MGQAGDDTRVFGQPAPDSLQRRLFAAPDSIAQRNTLFRRGDGQKLPFAGGKVIGDEGFRTRFDIFNVRP